MSPNQNDSTRRDLLKLSAAAAAALAASHLNLPHALAQDNAQSQQADNSSSSYDLPTPETTWKDGFPYRKLGKTGQLVSLLGLGGFHIGSAKSLDDSIKIIRTAIDRGITFMDNCWDYHNGRSEEWMGQGLRDGYRDKVFLMTKIDSHSKEGALKQIDESLKRLQTDRIDLIQHHEIVRPDDPDKIFAPGGSHEAMLEAQKAGKLRFIGFTGHKDPAYHLHMLDTCIKNNYPLTSVQMPVNVLDAHYKSFSHQVLPRLLKHDIAPLAMKTCAAGGIVKNKIATPAECLHFAMSLPIAVAISGMESLDILEKNLATARSFKPLTPEQLATLLDRTRQYAQNGKHEGFKTTKGFDGTANNPDWLT